MIISLHRVAMPQYCCGSKPRTCLCIGRMWSDLSFSEGGLAVNYWYGQRHFFLSLSIGFNNVGLCRVKTRRRKKISFLNLIFSLQVNSLVQYIIDLIDWLIDLVRFLTPTQKEIGFHRVSVHLSVFSQIMWSSLANYYSNSIHSVAI